MDEAVRLSMAKWPDVPACFGWLSLNPRGQWLLGPEREAIHHRGLNEFISRNYLADEQGRWYCQNGPQQVFVTLDYCPWVYRSRSDGHFETHTGRCPDQITAAWLDEAGHLGLVSELGPGTLDDRDLAAQLEQLRHSDGTPLSDTALEALVSSPLESPTPSYMLQTAPGPIPLHRWYRAHIPQRFGFVQQPQA